MTLQQSKTVNVVGRSSIAALLFVACTLVCATSFAQEATQSEGVAEPTGTTPAAAQPQTLAVMKHANFQSRAAQRGALLQRATHSVVRAVKSGLVLFDVDTKRGSSRLYVEVDTSGSASLRWYLRF